VKCRIAWRRLFATTFFVKDGTHLTTWVSRETKARFAAVALHQGLSESALLKRLVDLMLQTAGVGNAPSIAATRSARGSRLTVRLHPDDLALLRERSAARGMAGATYISVVTRAHLRSLAPLPKGELLALKQSISELGNIGRNLNQITHAVSRGERVAGLGRDDLRALLKVCGGLRDHVKALLSANVKAWDQGYAEPNV
jgi:hypothetical protein